MKVQKIQKRNIGRIRKKAVLNLGRIISHVFPVNKYFKQEYEKTQIVLHHTVSGEGVSGDLTHWIKNKFKIGTCVIIGRRGDINQIFSSKYWAYHLGVPSSTYRKFNIPYKRHDMNSIGIEIDSYGGLKWNVDKKRWETVYGNPISSSNVVEYPEGYRGYYAFERYTTRQIESTRQLIVYWSERYNIPLHYHSNMFETNADALLGVSGIWSHTSFRLDKSDIHPQKELIEMLKGLK